VCRFVGYLGPELLLADLLYRPANSLIRQSFDSKERREPLNGDGFGVGWYTPEISSTPGLGVSVTPAWNNQNLHRASKHIRSRCIFAHVRAASPGMHVSEANCHPFQHGRFLWMHNGTIAEFWRIKRRLRASLPDHLYHKIEGTTDSEHAFSVFLHLLGDCEALCPAADMGDTLVKTIAQLEKWSAEAGISRPSYYNFAVTDGQSMAAVRYVSDPNLQPASLYYSSRGKYECHEGVGKLLECHVSERSVIIASERLTSDETAWVRVETNHVLTVDPKLTVHVEPVDVTRIGFRLHEPLPAESPQSVAALS
jgi:glutamine amidotransferase